MTVAEDAERFRRALELIVKTATTPDGPVGTLPGGINGPTWTVGGRERALEKAIEIAREALDGVKP